MLKNTAPTKGTIKLEQLVGQTLYTELFAKATTTGAVVNEQRSNAVVNRN